NNSRKIVDGHLKNQTWSLPSTIYADAPVLYEGMQMRSKTLIDYLQRLNYQEVPALSVDIGEYSVGKATVVFEKHPFFSSQSIFPVAVEFDQSGINKITNAKSKEEIPAYEMEPVPISNLFGSDWEKRTLVHYNEIPPYLVQAVIAIEDRRFYSHSGV